MKCQRIFYFIWTNEYIQVTWDALDLACEDLLAVFQFSAWTRLNLAEKGKIGQVGKISEGGPQILSVPGICPFQVQCC